MENNTQNLLSFSDWAKKVSSEHPEVLKQMIQSTIALDRVIAKRIMLAAGRE